MIAKKIMGGKSMEYKLIEATELFDLSKLSSHDKENILKMKHTHFYKPVDYDYPIYKVTFNIDRSSTFKELEIYCQRTETQISRWDKAWEDCGMPIGIFKIIKV